MEFLNISDLKLKVTLSPEECLQYGVDKYSDERFGAEMRRSVREILSAAERECGFTVGQDRILVQLYPLPSGVAELLVTRLTTISRKDRAVLSSAAGIALMEKKRGTYRFADLDAIIGAARAVSGDPKADLYCDDFGRYYIRVEEDFTDGISELEILIEYGERLSALPLGAIAEYGELLAKDNAFEYIRRLSSNM